jgi:hypothetical protein
MRCALANYHSLFHPETMITDKEVLQRTASSHTWTTCTTTSLLVSSMWRISQSWGVWSMIPAVGSTVHKRLQSKNTMKTEATQGHHKPDHAEIVLSGRCSCPPSRQAVQRCSKHKFKCTRCKSSGSASPSGKPLHRMSWSVGVLPLPLLPQSSTVVASTCSFPLRVAGKVPVAELVGIRISVTLMR